MYTVAVEIDDSALRERLERIARQLTGSYAPTLERVADRLARSFDLQFHSGNLAPLKQSTIKSRERRVRRGETLVAGLDTPLRAFHDRLRIAATATKPGVAGSAFEVTPDSVTIGIDANDLRFAPFAMGLRGHNTIRNPLIITDETTSEVIDLLRRDVATRLE